MAFFKAESKQNSMAMSLTSRQIVLAEEEALDQPALMCLPHHRALPEEDVAIHHQGNMNIQLVSYLFNT